MNTRRTGRVTTTVFIGEATTTGSDNTIVLGGGTYTGGGEYTIQPDKLTINNNITQLNKNLIKLILVFIIIKQQ
jgi:hypothetical protein